MGNTPLLKNVKAISTVSGGTISGVYYARHEKLGTPFQLIYKGLIDWLTHTDLVKEGLKKININGNWSYPYKRKNIINAFAELYDSTLLNRSTLKDLQPNTNSHLEFVCFNATEFNRGLRYRFQVSKGRVFFGSNGLQLGKSIYNEFRLGDVIAASSAFSGGFEPIAMPEDFLAPDSTHFQKVKQKKGYKESVGLMDGGIYDNQGITGIEEYEDNKGIEPFDLILISDVSSPYIKDFDFSIEKNGSWRDVSINGIRKKIKIYDSVAKIVLIYMMISALLLVIKSGFVDSTILGVGITLYILTLLLVILYFHLKGTIFKFFKRVINYFEQLIPTYFRNRISSFEYLDTQLKRFEILFLDRFTSLKLLLPGIFLKQIRRLHYDRLYTNENYENRRLSCLVRQLTKSDFDFKRSMNLDDLEFLSEKLPDDFDEKTFDKIVGKRLAFYTEKAANFGTTLWFTEEDQLEETLTCLLVSGQATCCQSLLVYLTKLIHSNDFKRLDNGVKANLLNLQEKVLEDWREFKIDPLFLHELLIGYTKD